jgi:hypothetical protein
LTLGPHARAAGAAEAPKDRAHGVSIAGARRRTRRWRFRLLQQQSACQPPPQTHIHTHTHPHIPPHTCAPLPPRPLCRKACQRSRRPSRLRLCRDGAPHRRWQGAGTLQHCRHAGRPGLRVVDNLVNLPLISRPSTAFVLVGSAVINTHAHRDIHISHFRRGARARSLPVSQLSHGESAEKIMIMPVTV